MTRRSNDLPPPGAVTLSGQRFLVSGALNMLPLVRALAESGAEVVASDSDAARLALAVEAIPAIRCLPADLDLTLDARRLAVGLQRLGGCDVAVHHMGGDADPTPGHAASAFLRAFRLIHALRPRMQAWPGSQILLTGCPAGCARSMAIVLDRAGAFRPDLCPGITSCLPEELPALLQASPGAGSRQAMQRLDGVALAG